MKEPSLVELAIAALGFVLFVIVAWKIAAALARRGVAVRPVSLMDFHMTRIERQARDRKSGSVRAPDRD